MRKLSKTYLTIILILTPLSLFSQTTNSPYSIFGLGHLEGRSTGPSNAMGGTGIAFLSSRYINPMNPASYTGIDSLISVFELGLFAKYTTYSTKDEDQSLLNANLKYIMMGFRITPWLASSFGFSPYSSVGYTINTTSPIEGSTLEYPKTFSGEGGVNQVYFGSSVNLIKGLSLGLNAAYLFGNITHRESSELFNYSLEDATYISNFNIDYGLNYQFDIKKLRYNIGLIYGRSKKLKTNNVTTIETDYETEILKSRNYKYSIPQNIGAGIAVSKGFFRAGIDYEWSAWENVEFTNSYLRTRNSSRYSFGVEFPSQGLNKGTSKMLLYRFGAEYSGSYMIIDNMPINYGAITFGAGIPLKGIISVLNASVELGQNGTTKKDLFRERFVTINLDLSLWDLWFRKRKYD